MPNADVSYGLCPRCGRAVPASAGERYCLNDGSPMLLRCPQCGAKFTSPYSQFCGHCGLKLGGSSSHAGTHQHQTPSKETPK
ncbi:double zinc ribbon domain-containing protein [Deinococcus sp.]|uniref:double zinc ribbon domain-containing protein n=1 Tax=Deinococcus sp. TaxID=47478 RepID=UPI003B5A3AA6